MSHKLYKTKFSTALIEEFRMGLVSNGRLEDKHPRDYDFYFEKDEHNNMHLIRIDDCDVSQNNLHYASEFVLTFQTKIGGWGKLTEPEWITK